MGRQLAIARRVSLADAGPGWTDECYALMLPATYEDMRDADEIGQKSKKEQVDFQLDFVKKHFVSGKVMIDGSNEPVDMLPEDLSASVTISDRLFMGILGTDLDPKEVRQAAAAANEQKNEEPATPTPSSTK